MLPRGKKLCALNLGSPLVVLNGFNSKEAPTPKPDQKTVEFPTGEQERQIMGTTNGQRKIELAHQVAATKKRLAAVESEIKKLSQRC